MRGDGRRLSIATWNIRAAIGPGEPFPAAWWRHVRRERLEAIADFVVGLDADVVCLQEVALASADGEPLDQPSELARLTARTVRYGALHHYTLVEPGGGEVGATMWGNAILSRLPIVSTAVHALPIPGDDDLVEPTDAIDRFTGERHRLAGVRYAEAGIGPREARCAVECTVDGGGHAVRVLTTHLAYVGREQRRAQAAALAALSALGADRNPVVLAGDLNAAVGDPELEPLRDPLSDAFTAVGIEPADPARDSCGGHPLDHVLVDGLAVADCRVERAAGDLSDHWPVRATFRL